MQVQESLAEYGIRPRLVSLWQEGHSKPGLQSLEQSCLLALMRSYKDILYTKHPYPQRSGLYTTPLLVASIIINGEMIYAGQHQSCVSWYKTHAPKGYLLCGNKLARIAIRAVYVLCNGVFWMRTDYQHFFSSFLHCYSSPLVCRDPYYGFSQSLLVLDPHITETMMTSSLVSKELTTCTDRESDANSFHNN